MYVNYYFYFYFIFICIQHTDEDLIKSKRLFYIIYYISVLIIIFTLKNSKILLN